MQIKTSHLLIGAAALLGLYAAGVFGKKPTWSPFVGGPFAPAVAPTVNPRQSAAGGASQQGSSGGNTPAAIIDASGRALSSIFDVLSSSTGDVPTDFSYQTPAFAAASGAGGGWSGFSGYGLTSQGLGPLLPS